MSVYSYLDYRDVIQDLLASRRKLDKTWTFQRLAQEMRLQKSYLSQVLKGRAEINSDQMYLLAKALKLKPEETSYLLLCLEYSRSSLNERRSRLRAEIQEIQKRKVASEEHLKVEPLKAADQELIDYYLDAYNQLVHVCLSQARFRKKPELLADLLGLHPERLNEILRELERLGVIEIGAAGITVLRKNLHLSKEAKVFKAWRAQVRQMALQKSLQSRGEDTYNFSVVFSCSAKARRELHERFLEYLKEAQTLVNESEAEHVYQMNFDLLNWL